MNVPIHDIKLNENGLLHISARFPEELSVVELYHYYYHIGSSCKFFCTGMNTVIKILMQ